MLGCSRILETHGVCVDSVENSKLAVEAGNASVSGTYAAILMDIYMPVMDRLQVYVCILGLPNQDVKILLLSP